MDLIWLAASYVLGSIPSAYIVARALRGIDIRRYGTGNVGGGNVWDTISFRAFLFVGLADAAKGALAVAVAQRLGLDLWMAVACGWAAIIGHNWSIFLRRAGGKGLATLTGAMFALAPLLATIFLLTLLVPHFLRNLPVWTLRQGPIWTIIGLIAAAILAWLFGEPPPIIVYILGGFVIHMTKRVLDIKPPWQIPAAERKRVLIDRFFLDGMRGD